MRGSAVALSAQAGRWLTRGRSGWPQAQRCDLMTAVAREEMFFRALERPIPTFFAGSTLAVEYMDRLSNKKPSRVVCWAPPR